jgi:taurine transport system ATP-binding protein
MTEVTSGLPPSHLAREAAPDRVTMHGGAVAIRGVTKSFVTGGVRRRALQRIDLDLAGGELVALVGPSGCGKSTLLNLIAGFTEPSTGHVLVDGHHVTGPGADRGFVFQQPRLLPWLSVRSNVELGPRFSGARAADRRALAEEMLELVGLAGEGDRPPYELSGGMQQRASIARALAARPRILLLDEPFAALDALTREQLQDELRRIWQATGTTMVLITHSVDEATYVGTRIVALTRGPGRIVFDEPGLGQVSQQPGLRSTSEFLALRDRVHHVVVRSAQGNT